MKSGLTTVILLNAVLARTQTSCENYGTTTPWNPLWNFTNMTQKKVSGINIANKNYFHGLLEYAPPSYTQPANASKKYPVIIFFHGYGSRGNGSATELCRLFKDRGSDLATHLAIPGRIERQPSLFTPTVGGQTLEYLVISPQFDEYTRTLTEFNANDRYPSAEEVEDVIDYVEANYRIDPRRIYLTGLSNGANMITEYAASSLARAKRVAAIMPVALCSQLNHVSNTGRGIDATYIGQAKLKTWFVYCEVDNCGAPGTDADVPQAWVNAIKGVAGHEPPRYTILKNQNPATLYNCSDTLTHDAWSRAYDPNFTASYNYSSTGVLIGSDGQTGNIYDWFAESQSAVLPVTVKDYVASLKGGKVDIHWKTTDEKDNKSFLIERAGRDQRFEAIGTLPGMNNYQGEKLYRFTDEHPLSDLNYYRLVQVDVDGQINYLDIKKIVVRENADAVIVSPNPFQSEISAYVNLDRPQKLFISVTDMTGKVVNTRNGLYNAGTTEVRIPSQALSKGIYLLKVSGESVLYTGKVVKK